jgi:hypothetical protein
MSYFKELPNLEYVNRFPNAGSNSEITIAKNLFKRPKIREDLSSVITAFEYYTIVDGERPDQIAERIYGSSDYDWVILITNNIINYYNEWPLSSAELNGYLLEKYGNEENLSLPHHYETIELKDSFGRIVLPGGLWVDEAFYNAPEYETIESLPPGITFPQIYLDPIESTVSIQLDTDPDNLTRVGVTSILNGGRGYTSTPRITFSEPTTTLQASASCGISTFRVTSIVGLNTGKGYRSVPNITISPPPTSIQSVVTAELGTGLDEGKVISTIINESGLGYGLTSPSISFELPDTYTNGSSYKRESPISTGSQIDGMFVGGAGTKIFTSSGIGTSQIKSFNLSSSWDISTLTLNHELNVSSKFSYCSGVELSPDGTKLFISGGLSGSFLIARYDLASQWDLTTASFVNQITVTAPGGIRFKPDGTRMYILNSNSPDSIEEYSLSSAWNITSKTFISSYNIQTDTGDSGILGFSFNSDGTKMYATGIDNASVYEFSLDSWDLTTLQLQTSLYVGDRISNPSDIFVNTNIENFFICGGVSDKIFEYDINVRAKGFTSLINGSISSITITQPGLGYTTPPQITISSPYPAVQAQAIANMSGGYVSSITITNTGFGYTTTPSLTISQPPTYSTAVGYVTVSNGQIDSIVVVDPGLNYDTPPTVSFDTLPEPVLNVEVNETYSQNNKTWRWNGSNWQEKITEEFKFLNGENVSSVVGSSVAKIVNNYEYEVNLNEEKRLILLPRPSYIPIIEKNFKDMMKYDKNSDYSKGSKLKTTYNPKLTGV